MSSYLFLCLYPIILYGADEINSYLGYAIRLFTAGLIANYFARRLPEIFENIIFILAYISIPLFILQLINPHFFDILTPISKILLNDDRLYYSGPRGVSMHQYAFIYVMNGWALDRNSGFMWEPAAFGAVVTWAIIFNLFINKFKFNKKLLVLIIAGVSTFSLGFFMYFLVFILIFIFQNHLSLKKMGLFISITALFALLISRTTLFESQYQMISSKYKSQIQTDSKLRKVANTSALGRGTRVDGFFYNIKYFTESPFGYGMENQKIILESANGLTDLMTKWGVVGLVLILLCYYNAVLFLKKKYFMGLTKLSFILCMLLFIMPLSGNPFYNAIFVFTIMVFPFYASQKQLI